MAKIGLLNDSHNFPNLCSMKLSAWHKAKGDETELWTAEHEYDTVYVSKVFTESILPDVTNARTVFRGGSGYDLENKLPYEIEHIMPDYSLYPQFDFALGVLTRGCPRKNHGFCITPKKDGCISRKVADLSEFWCGQKNVTLLDQNLLACRERMDLLSQIRDSGATFNMDGGTDARFMTGDVLKMFRDIKIKDYHFAWDDPRENLGERFLEIAMSGICRPRDTGVYVLTNYWSSTEEDLFRVYTLRFLGFMPYIMIYDRQKFVDDKGHWKPGVELKYSPEQLRHFKTCQHMQRWANNRRIIKSCPDFNDYDRYANWVAKGKPVPGI